MLPEVLQDRAALYVSGAMPAEEREIFEVLLEFHGALREHVAALQETWVSAAVTQLNEVAPPLALKSRLLAALDRSPSVEPESLVVTDPSGFVLWVNLAFTDLCGYTLEELKGRKPGELLQGTDTDPAGVARIRAAVRERRACRESLVNYHKNGSAYRADIRIAPFLDDQRQPLWFVAKERKLSA